MPVYSKELLRLATPAADPPVRLCTAAQIRAHVAIHSTSPFKKSVLLDLEVGNAKAGKDHTTDAVHLLLSTGFNVAAIQYTTKLPAHAIQEQLRAVCSSVHTSDHLTLRLEGKHKLDLIQAFHTIALDKIKSLELISRKSLTDISAAISSFRSANRLTALDVSGYLAHGCISDWLVDPECSLRSMTMVECGLAGTSIVPAILNFNKTLKLLDISNNSLFPSDLRSICEALATNNTLSELVLNGNAVRGLESELGAAVAASAVSRLHLSNARFDDENGVELFVDALLSIHDKPESSCKILEYLDISLINIGPTGLKALGKSLPFVECLKAQACLAHEASRLDQWWLFSVSIAESTRLREIDLENNRLQGLHMWILCHALLSVMRRGCSGTVGALRQHTHYGLFSMLVKRLKRESDIDISELEMQQDGIVFNTMTRGLLSFVELASRDNRLEAEEVVKLSKAFEYAHAGRYSDIDLILNENEHSTPCIWQQNPAKLPPCAAPALEVLKLSNNVELGHDGALAICDFILNAPCHGVRTIEMQKCNVGDLGISYFLDILDKDSRLSMLKLRFVCLEQLDATADAIIWPKIVNEASVPWALRNKLTFMLCMKYSPVMRGRYVPSDVFNVVFSFLRCKVVRKCCI